jgi:2-dehydro-3-deoxygluconokinase
MPVDGGPIEIDIRRAAAPISSVCCNHILWKSGIDEFFQPFGFSNRSANSTTAQGAGLRGRQNMMANGEISAVKSIASIGECMIELSGGASGWKMGHAGDAFNTLWVLRALLSQNVATDFVSAFGTDPFSAEQVAFMAGNGIGVSKSPRLAAYHPGLYAITLDGGERSFTYWRSEAAARRLADDPALLEQSLAARQLIYFSGITRAVLDGARRQVLFQALDAARGQGALIAFDPNFRPRLWASKQEAQAAIGEALAHVDIALPTFPDEQALHGDRTPEETAARFFLAGVKETVVKNGADAALVKTADGSKSVPAIQVASPVDTTGAGDSFNGGYLAARLRGMDPVDAAECAHRVAAATVQVYGALAPAPLLQSAFARP